MKEKVFGLHNADTYGRIRQDTCCNPWWAEQELHSGRRGGRRIGQGIDHTCRWRAGYRYLPLM